MNQAERTTIADIPEINRQELKRIVGIIRRHAEVDLIILFGKYANGSMRSVLGGYELLLVSQQECWINTFKITEILDAAFCRPNRKEENIFLHSCSLSSLKSNCSKGNCFFISICNEGILVYDNKKCHYPIERQPYNPALHQAAYEHFADFAEVFLNRAESAWKDGQPRMAALNLFYTADMLFKAIESVFYGDVIRCSHLEYSYFRVRHFSWLLAESFNPAQNNNRMWYGQLLYYLRYSRNLPTFKVYEKDYQNCLAKLRSLRDIVDRVCREYINATSKIRH
jgi:hypothetical protein